jgi:hypothetical protein
MPKRNVVISAEYLIERTCSVQAVWDDGGMEIEHTPLTALMQVKKASTRSWKDSTETENITLNPDSWSGSFARMLLDPEESTSVRIVEKDADGNTVVPSSYATAWFDVTVDGVACRALYDVSYVVDEENPHHTTVTNRLRKITPTLKIVWAEDVTDTPLFINSVLQHYNIQTGRWDRVGEERMVMQSNGWKAAFPEIPELS